MPRRPIHRHPSSHRRPKTHRSFESDEKEGQMVTSEEKRQLILAHHAARGPRMGWGAGYYVAIAASCLVIVSGWWLTLDKNIRSGIEPGRDPLIQAVQESADRFGRTQDSQAEANERIEAEREALEATAATIQMLVGGASTSSAPVYRGTLPTSENKRFR